MAELFDVILGDMRSSRKNVNRLLSLGIYYTGISLVPGCTKICAKRLF